jgi:hypothetical protein
LGGDENGIGKLSRKPAIEPRKDRAMSDANQELIRGCLEILHRDIALANTYRLETTKLLLTIATALFAFTVSFPANP